MSLKDTIGMNLKYYRYKSGLSQEKFYTSLGLNYKYLACVERGEKNLTLEFIEEIAKKLHIETNDLIFFNKEHIIIKKRVDAKEKITI